MKYWASSLLLVAGCAAFERPITREPDRFTVTVSVNLVDRDEDLFKACRSTETNGCAYVFPDICVIYALRPKTFDSLRLQTLGHELYHCMGAVHP